MVRWHVGFLDCFFGYLLLDVNCFWDIGFGFGIVGICVWGLGYLGYRIWDLRYLAYGISSITENVGDFAFEYFHDHREF